MPARWKAGLALLALSMAGPLGAAPLTSQVAIARCASQADAKLEGVSALDAACVRDALDHVGLTALMSPDWRKTVTPGGLADLDALTRHYAGSPLSPPPRATALRSIAAGLVPPPPPPTWWGRISAWIRHWTSPARSLIGRWLRSLGPSFAHGRHALITFVGLSALLLAAVAAFLTMELRGTGLFRKQHLAAVDSRRRRGIAAAGSTPAVDAEIHEPDWSRLREQPARLLRLLVDILTRAHRLGHDRHLTCRELETEARFDTGIEREGFARLARLAERELYGPPGTTALSEEALSDVRMLYARLLEAAGKRADIQP